MVEEADVQETTKLLEVISVTDSEVSTSGGGGVVSPSDVSTGYREGGTFQLCEGLRMEVARRKPLLQCTHRNHGWW